MKKIRILIADDHILAREGLNSLLSGEEDFECVGVADDGEQAVRLVRELKPDIALIDVAMPKMNGIDVTREIKSTGVNTRVLIVSAYKYEHYVLSCITAGADGYLLKDNLHGDGLVNAVRMIYSGESVYDSEATSKVMRKIADNRYKGRPGLGVLGIRELEILKLAIIGMSNKEIAYKLGIRVRTVGTHFANIFRKLWKLQFTQLKRAGSP